ncbi:uncharacterized protein LOC105699442 [Orussus abietinus]|uniref:uncharacterized protein LOC105699442 n=1 Tax=Orussus abietinus TaxID=222816 RepID=UPI00062578AB|nr:uncharacterized protein LOC105699442 [Orussus abietinus]
MSKYGVLLTIIFAMSQIAKVLSPAMHKQCFVPNCNNSTTKTPNKIFINVPRNQDVRKLWCNAAGCPIESLSYMAFCCQDHFNLEHDVESNPYSHSGRKKLKKGIVPHIFACQEHIAVTKQEEKPIHLTQNEVEIPASVVMAESEQNISEVLYSSQLVINASKIVQEMPSIDEFNVPNCTKEETCKNASVDKEINFMDETNGINRKRDARSVNDESFDLNTKKSSLSNSSNACKDNGTFPKRIKNKNYKRQLINEIRSNALSNLVDAYEILSERSSSLDSLSELEKATDSSDEDNFRQKLSELTPLELTKMVIKDDPLTFIGIPIYSLHIIDRMQSKLNMPIENIYLILKKLRLNPSDEILVDDFGYSVRQVHKTLMKGLPRLVKLIRKLIAWPTEKNIIKTLPLQFRVKFGNVRYIIDSFEIEIEKPDSEVNQELMWSKKRACCTAKYLIAMTPDGRITYISEGFGGSATNTFVLENSGFLDKLPSGTTVIAMDNFEGVEALFKKKEFTLIQTPMSTTDRELTDEEVLLTKQIASIRIYADNVIKRIRDFRLLESHVYVEDYLVPYLDYILVIVAALVNFQSAIFP